MTLQSLSNSLESILRYDKSRLATVGRLIQNSIIYIVLIFLFGVLIDDIFPSIDESKPVYIIILEIVGQLILISFIIFYLQKIVDHIPFIGGDFYESNDSSLIYAEQAIILIILISTQKSLISKIRYIYSLFNDKNNVNKDEQEQKKKDSDKIKIIMDEQESQKKDKNKKKNIQTQEHLQIKDPNTINQRIDTYNQDDKLKYVAQNTNLQPIKPLLTSNDFLKDSMIMDYVNLVKDSNDKVDSNFNESKKVFETNYHQDNGFETFNNPSLSDSNSFGTSISQIPDFSQPIG